ncbi:outer membrane beta-barrel family protein [Taibaiella chishuiensis]|uniref:Outer membrane receptor protein involved in Fe transport n=1 Tax=Taibaiella chishuiensis TaxID=1434707 RepID=A0A2P8D402_9BACT|nr:outer membrane beta-barrel family protein [Taibaiella chishuiensis]PSK91932.1 outer membrane receptor protein involved in Fe transport [Taibaiella chishuiensis]
MKRLCLIIPLYFVFQSRTRAQEFDLSKINQKVQQNISYAVKVSGTVKDSVSKEALEFSSVTLARKGTKAEDGINSDSAGYFEFPKVEPGEYTLSVFYVGYNRADRSITVDSSGRAIDLGMIGMYSGSQKLKEVQVTDYRRLIEQRPDGIVYNADQDATNKGTTADQLLRKVPMLTVDLDGNVQMRGNGNIKVLIDGKPSTIIAATVKDALRQIPSENIKSVEVITSPGAKYDAEGTAGVINIITKKNLMKGLSGAIYSGLNYRLEQKTVNGYGGVYASYRNKKFGLTGNLGGGRWTSKSEGTTTRTDFPGTPQESVLKQTNNNTGGGPFMWGSLTADYDIDSLQSVQAGFNVNPGNWKNDLDQHTSYPKMGLDYSRVNNSETPRSNYAFNGSYSKKFRSNPKRVLDILSMYSIDNNTSKYDLTQWNNVKQVNDYQERNENKSVNKEFTLQADYTHPFAKHNQKLETGLKYINRNVSSDYALSNWTMGTGSDFIPDPARTNRLGYTQQVAAAYAQFTTNISKQLSAIVGLRYEHTAIDGSLRDRGGKFNSSFDNVLPNAILSWDLKNFNKLKLSYNQRIERPSITYINPYTDFSDPLNVSTGNPSLAPEQTHNIELGYSTMLGNSTINLSGFYRRTGNAIEAYTEVGSDGVSRSTYGNVAVNNTLGMNLFGSTRLFERWTINLNGNLYYKMLKSGGLGIENKGVQYDFNLYSSVKITDKLSAEGFGMYAGQQVMLQGTQTGWYFYTVGLKRTVLKGKGDLTLVAENFFTPKIKMVTDYTYLNANFRSENMVYARGFRISFNYRFGKMSFTGPKKSIDNDDLKENKGGGQQGAGGQMGGGGR